MKPRSRKAKGTAGEKEVLHDFSLSKWEGRLQPGSGVYSAFPHDVQVWTPGKSFNWNIEVKRRNGQKAHQKGTQQPGAVWSQGEKWLGKADLLMCRADYGEWFTFMKTSTLHEVCRYIVQLEEENERLKAAAEVRAA